jgi:CHAT domain-containing protein/tetratricopeptide (TPR) repeat protein
MSPRKTGQVLLIVFFLFAPSAANGEPPLDLSDCETRFTAAPYAEEPAKCFYDLGLNTPLSSEAQNRMRRNLARYPDSPWLLLYLGHFMYPEPAKAEPLYERAAAACAARKIPYCEVVARINLQRILDDQGHVERAELQIKEAERVAEASKIAELIARARMVRARHLYLLGQDLERAYLLLRKAKEFAFPDGPYALRRETLIWIGNVSLELGRSREAQGYFQQLAELASGAGDSLAESSARYNLARAFLDGIAEVPRPGDKERAISLARQALAKADEAQNSTIQAKSHWLLSLLLAGNEAQEHLDACLRVADNVRDRSYCLNALAKRLAAKDPRMARAMTQEALALAHQAEDSLGMAFAWRERMRDSWVSGSRERAIEDSQAALEAIETLRDLQGGAASRVGLFSSWSEDYSWFSGRLLEAWSAGEGPGRLDSAFEVLERKRARTLLDALSAASAAPVQPARLKPLQERLSQIHEDISQVQRQLLDPALPAPQLTTAQADLERLELEEQDLRDRIAEASPALSALRAPSFASLAQVRASLAPDEALLSFQIAPDRDVFGDFAGGSWVVVSTRGASRAWRLHRDRVALRPAVELFNGLFARRDGSEAAPAAGLYRELLSEALASLPPGIRRLVIIPDDTLHQIPFAGLRAGADAEPLIARYEIVVVPSATLWLHWRGLRNEAAPAPLLALADPIPPGSGKGGGQPAVARERAAVFGDAVRLGSLPFARREGRAAVRQLGGESLLRVGEAASEGFLKQADLRRFGILHFATHAVLDEQNPERSGVLLTPAPASEDGLLQIREIVPLHLEGRIVVLSSCRSASGAVLRGEGVMGIARAFFQAGAHTVVASLWPLRDDDGAALFERFYRHLAQGKSVAAALRSAQLDRIADGAPGYAWAGLVVLGEGDLVPMPGGRPDLPIGPWIWAAGGAALILLLAAGAFLTWNRRHPRK